MTGYWALTGAPGTAWLAASGGGMLWRGRLGLISGVSVLAATWLVGGWGTARTLRVSGVRGRLIASSWVVAGLLAFLVGHPLALVLEATNIGSLAGPGFLGYLVGAAVAGAAGGGVTGWLCRAHGTGDVTLPVRAAVAGGIGFGLASLLAMIGFVVLGQLVKLALGWFVGPNPAVVIGAALGGLPAGALAGWILGLGLAQGDD